MIVVNCLGRRKRRRRSDLVRGEERVAAGMLVRNTPGKRRAYPPAMLELVRSKGLTVPFELLGLTRRLVGNS